MARKKPQEELQSVYDDNPLPEAETTESSGRGREIKLGLLVLGLFFVAASYVVVKQFRSGGEALPGASAEVAAARQDADSGPTSSESVVPAHVPAVVRPESDESPNPLMMAQWNDPSQQTLPPPSEETPLVSTPGDPMVNVPSQWPEVEPSQSRSAGYGVAGGYNESTESTGMTFAPVPNPEGYTDWSTPAPIAPPVADASVPGDWPQVGAEVRGATTAPVYRATAEPAPLPGGSSYPAMTEAPLAPAYAASAATADSSQGYTRSYDQKTPAGYVGLSGGNSVSGAPRGQVDTWQQPTVSVVGGKYEAQPNDSFFIISKKVYGSGAYYRALARHNRDKYPKANDIRLGDVLDVPPPEQLEARYPALCPKADHRDAGKRRAALAGTRSLADRRVYVVQAGDTLFDIARYELGSRARVAELINMNRDVLGTQVNYLTPGMKLVLPGTEAQAPAITQGPTGTLR